MAGWLSRATAVFRAAPPAPPQTYDIVCDCGASLHGERRSQPQRFPCSSCGRMTFVLPNNIYPKTSKATAKKTASKSPPAPKWKDGETEEIRNSVETEEITVRGPKGAKPRSGGKDKRGKEEAPKPAPPQGIAVDQRVKLFTPFRALVGAMAVVVALTGWSLVQRWQSEAAQSAANKATDAGLKALEEGDFPTAAKELGIARAAVDRLKRSDERSQLVRRAEREAAAAHGLATVPLMSILRESIEDFSATKQESARFESLYRSQWLLFDANLDVPLDGALPISVDLPLIIEGLEVHVEVASPDLRAVLSTLPEDAPKRALFAAPMKRFKVAKGDTPLAVMTLDGETLVLWTDPETLKLLTQVNETAEESQATRAILDRQLNHWNTVNSPAKSNGSKK